MRHVKREYSKLLLELKFLHADLEYHELVFEEAKEDFAKDLNDFSSKHELQARMAEVQKSNEEQATEVKVKSDLDPDDDIFDASKARSNIKDKDLKKLFKEVATKTHPDKLTEEPDSILKTKKLKMFLAAKKAAEESDWFKLQEIAAELGIELPEPNKNQVLLLRDKIQDIKDKIKKICNTFAWKYSTLEKDENKESLMKQYVKIAFGISL